MDRITASRTNSLEDIHSPSRKQKVQIISNVHNLGSTDYLVMIIFRKPIDVMTRSCWKYRIWNKYEFMGC